jgi:hypothetical protein
MLHNVTGVVGRKRILGIDGTALHGEATVQRSLRNSVSCTTFLEVASRTRRRCPFFYIFHTVHYSSIFNNVQQMH